MVVGAAKGTLTRQYQIHDLVAAAGKVTPGMSIDQAQAVLDTENTPHAGLARRLFAFDTSSGLIEDELVRACRDPRDDAELLMWTALLLADYRIAQAVEKYLTDSEGAFDPARFRADYLTVALKGEGIGSPQKAASNILRYLERAGLIEAQRHGGSIVGIVKSPNPMQAVPGIVTLVSERARKLEPALTPSDLADPVQFCIDRGVNRWVGLPPVLFQGYTEARPPKPPAIEDEDADLNHFKPKDDSDYVANVKGRKLYKRRQHETLLAAYVEWITDQGFGASSPHPVDLLLKSKGDLWLVEAKVLYRGNATIAVRGVIGQVFTYSHFLYPTNDPHLVGLFSEEIGDAYVGLLEKLGIMSVWRKGKGWEGSDSATASGLA